MNLLGEWSWGAFAFGGLLWFAIGSRLRQRRNQRNRTTRGAALLSPPTADTEESDR